MSEEGNKKLFAHYTAVAGGSVKSSNSVSNELIVADAKINIADLIKKNPSLVVESEDKGYSAEGMKELREKIKNESKSKEKK